MDNNDIFIGLTFLLIIWVFVIQLKLNELSIDIKSLKQNNKKICQQKSDENQKSNQDIVLNDHNEQSTTISNNNQYNKTTPTSSQTKQVSKDSEFENIFLGNIFNKIGAIAIIIAVGIFIKLISPFIIFTPLMKTTLGFLFGIILLVISVKLHKDNLKNYAEVLMGTGLASLFITTYCAYNLLHTIQMPTAISIATIILIASFYIADKLQTSSALVIGLIGGYINPFIINTNVSGNFTLGYLIFLNLLTLIFTYKNENKSYINFINIPIFFITGTYYLITNTFSNFIPFILCGLYILFDILTTFTKKKSNSALILMNYALLTFFAIEMYQVDKTKIGIFFGITSLIYALLTYLYSKFNKKLYKPYLYTIIANIWLVVYYLATDMQSIIIWSLEALCLVVFATKYKNLKELDNWAIAIFISVIIGIFLARENGVHYITTNYTNICNPRMLLFGIPILTTILSSHFITQNGSFKENLYSYLAIILGFTYLHYECNSFIATHQNLNIDYLTSVMWITYAGVISVFGILKNKEFLKNAGIWLSLLSVARIFFHDIAALDTIYKLIAFIVLGSILMLISYFYIKKAQ